MQSQFIGRLTLRNFRGVARGELDLAPLTILVGPNNSGKTTVLEALLLTHGFREIAGIGVYNVLSEIHGTLESDGLDHLVYSYGAKATRAAVVFTTKGVSKAVVIDVTRRHMHFYYVEGVGIDKLFTFNEQELKKFKKIADVERFVGGGNFASFKVAADVVIIRSDLLRHYHRFVYRVWTDLTNKGITGAAARWVSKIAGDDYLDVLAEPLGGKSTLFLYKSDGSRIRLGDLGDGVQILITAKLIVDYLDPDIVLWDDIEAHMNPRALQLLALWLADLVDSGKQVVASTHSLEAARLIANIVERACIVKIMLDQGELKAQYITPKELEKLTELGVDVRA